MLDFVMGIGFALVIEGVLWGLFPALIIKAVMAMAQTDEKIMRYGGVVSVGLGVALIWYVQHMRGAPV